MVATMKFVQGEFMDEYRLVFRAPSVNDVWQAPDSDLGVDIQDDGSIRAVCFDALSRIWGVQTLRCPTWGNHGGWEGLVTLGDREFSAFTAMDHFEHPNGHVVAVASIHARTGGWEPSGVETA